VCSGLKNEGFGSDSKAAILAALDSLSVLDSDTKTATFIANVHTYLEDLSHKSTLLEQAHLLVSSDIIESFFGKFKTKINVDNRSGLTEFLFTIANFTKAFSIEEIKKALETT
jgi:hypothetical protein